MTHPESIDNLEDHKREALITQLTPEEKLRLEKQKHITPPDETTTIYEQYQHNWYNALESAKMYREMESDNRFGKKSMFKDSNSDWTTVPQLVVPDLIDDHMRFLFGKSWGSFNNLRYYVWLYFPQFRPTQKWHSKKKGISRKHVPADFASDLKGT